MPVLDTDPSGWLSGDADVSRNASLWNTANSPTASSGSSPPATLAPQYDLSPCLWIFVKFIGNTYIVPWDIFLLVPNALFFLFLLATFRRSVTELRNRSSPLVTTFYVLICLTCMLSTARCVTIMFFSRFNTLHNQILWLVVRFFQLVTELSVLILGIIYGPSDSISGIRRVLVVTILLSIAYTVGQGALEKLYHKVYFNQDLYLHGGLLFTLISSACFFVIYFVTTCLPLLPLQRCGHIVLPQKRSFYVYTTFLCVVNVLGCLGASLVEELHNDNGFCMVSASLFVYFGLFAPIIYLVFLQPVLWYRREGEVAAVNGGEEARLLNCDYNVHEPLDYSSSALASGRKGISAAAAIPQTEVDAGYGSSYGSLNKGLLVSYASGY